MLRSTNYAVLFFRSSMSAQTKFRQVFRTTCKRLTLLFLSFSSTFVATPADKPTSQSTARINKPFSRSDSCPFGRSFRSCTFVCLTYPMYESINTSIPHVGPSHKGEPDIIEVVPVWAFSRPCQPNKLIYGSRVSRLPSVPYPFGLYRLLIMIYFCTPYLIVIIRYTTYQ